MKSKLESNRQEISRKIDKYWVPIIARTIELLDCFGSAAESLTLEEVVQRTGIPHTTAYRILHTLVLRDYLTQTGRQYRLNRLRRKLRFGFANLSRHICIAVEIQRSLEKATAAHVFRYRYTTLQSFPDLLHSRTAVRSASALLVLFQDIPSAPLLPTAIEPYGAGAAASPRCEH